jgi:transcriptional regulator with XRE-family HTH domain
MEELIANLGKKLRYYRTKKDITLKALAESIGVTPSLLSQIEHGKAAPSIGTLKALADVFEVPIGILFEMSSKPAVSPHVKKNTFKRIMTEGNILHSLLSPGCEDLEVFLNDFPPGAMTGEKPYSHDGVECGYLLEGQLSVEVEGKEYVLEEGDSVILESFRPHRVVNKSDKPAKAVWVESVPWVFKSE